jgi:hypothetical protein
LPTETVLNERTTDSTQSLVVEISEELEQGLRSEHMRLSAEANPTPIDWDRFLQVCLIIGLDELKRIPALEALECIDRLEG